MAPSQIDPLLLPYLESTDEREEAVLLVRLVTEQADPVIRRILGYKLQFYLTRNLADSQHPDAEEIYADIRLYLLKRLRQLKEDPFDKPVANLLAYVATIARNGCDEYLRRKYPRRRQLKDRIRYCLTHDSGVALWEDADLGLIGGLAGWEQKRASPLTPLNSQSIDDLEELSIGLRSLDANRLKLRNLLQAIFEASGRPIELDCLTGLIATLWGLEDRPAESIDGDDRLSSTGLYTSPADADSIIEYQQILRKLWVEICQLSLPHRVALLLNLRDPNGINIITLFPSTCVATFEQIAAVLEIAPQQFEEMCAALPMDDLSIARYLGITRQQVVNLRRTARDRLARRIMAFQKPTVNKDVLNTGVPKY
jgi:DNA-directed RNA polymerase specialized sigma24 family protein